MIATVVFLIAATSSIPESIILGDWCAGSKYAFHEEFSLEKDQEGRTFRSWLHHKPALDGKWELIDRTLTIRGRNGDTMEYAILKATRKTLVVREKNEKYRETYVRPGRCLQFPDPLH